MSTEKTKQLLQPLIERPPLTDQLLQRPPFRFILDIVFEVSNKTGFLKDVYAPDELEITAMINKDVKIEFLRKLIAALNTDDTLNDVKPGKILAGKEPEMTNLLLQKLAVEAAKFWHQMSEKVSNVDNVDDTSKNKNPEKKEKSSEHKHERKEDKHRRHSKSRESKERTEDKKKRKEGEEKEKDKKKDKEKKQCERGDSGEKKEKTSHHRAKEDKSAEKKRDKSKDHHKKDSGEKSEKKTKHHKDASNSTEKKKKLKNADEESELQNALIVNETPKGSSGPDIQEISVGRVEQEPSGTAKTEDSGIADMHNDVELPISSPKIQPEMQRPMPLPSRPQTSAGRPGTAVARNAPPKLKKKQIAEIEPKVEAPLDAPTILTDEKTDEDNKDFIVECVSIEPDLIAGTDADKARPNTFRLNLEDHGLLVKKILETKKELEANLEDETYASTSLFDENEQTRHKTDVESLQKTVQQLTQTLYPLTKLFDYAQEDIDNMMQEMSEWRVQKQKYASDLKKNSVKKENKSEELMTVLKKLDGEIREKRSAIVRVRANIIKNETQIQNLLNNV